MSDNDKKELLDLIATQKDQIIEMREKLVAQDEQIARISEQTFGNDERDQH